MFSWYILRLDEDGKERVAKIVDSIQSAQTHCWKKIKKAQDREQLTKDQDLLTKEQDLAQDLEITVDSEIYRGTSDIIKSTIVLEKLTYHIVPAGYFTSGYRELKEKKRIIGFRLVSGVPTSTEQIEELVRQAKDTKRKYDEAQATIAELKENQKVANEIVSQLAEMKKKLRAAKETISRQKEQLAIRSEPQVSVTTTISTTNKLFPEKADLMKELKEVLGMGVSQILKPVMQQQIM